MDQTTVDTITEHRSVKDSIVALCREIAQRIENADGSGNTLRGISDDLRANAAQYADAALANTPAQGNRGFPAGIPPQSAQPAEAKLDARTEREARRDPDAHLDGPREGPDGRDQVPDKQPPEGVGKPTTLVPAAPLI